MNPRYVRKDWMVHGRTGRDGIVSSQCSLSVSLSLSLTFLILYAHVGQRHVLLDVISMNIITFTNAGCVRVTRDNRLC